MSSVRLIPVTLAASSARTADGNGDTIRLLSQHSDVAEAGIAFVLDVTAAATDSGDTLGVKIQTKMDGTNWVDVAAFTQVTGNGGAKRHFLKIVNSGSQSAFENGTALSAGSVRNLFGQDWRASWAITDASTDNASFTFSVVAIPQ